MMAHQVIVSLADIGVTLRVDGAFIVADPREALTPEARDLIRAHKADLIATLAGSCFGLSAEFRAAVALGRLHLCGNCSRFAVGRNPTGPGHCVFFNIETWPYVPFNCSRFEVSPAPAAADPKPHQSVSSHMSDSGGGIPLRKGCNA
ncbi:MAG TPA: hypothetical protein VN790_07605 [Steroidobacteraceae bacterium]|nr:hypothetical protein [Steroidobacteraceae bacterium]